MLIHEKMVKLYTDHFEDLGDSEQDFIEECFENVSPEFTGLLVDDDLSEYITPRQMEWINRIWERVNG